MKNNGYWYCLQWICCFDQPLIRRKSGTFSRILESKVGEKGKADILAPMGFKPAIRHYRFANHCAAKLAATKASPDPP